MKIQIENRNFAVRAYILLKIERLVVLKYFRNLTNLLFFNYFMNIYLIT